MIFKLGHNMIRLFPFLVVVYLFAAFPNERNALAQSRPGFFAKVSADLLERVQRRAGRDRVNVIVQFEKNASRDQLDRLLLNGGAVATRRFRNINTRVVSLPANAVEALAAHSQVRYISLDKPIKTFGHVTTTTGTEAIRTQTVTSLLGIDITTTLDGAGIGIAIVDSGIDADHSSFRNSLGLSRVIVNQDFTGENRTDDVYGHGTHVASIAAGRGVLSNDAYTGIAPAASLVNLRVLGSQGEGSTSGLLAALDWLLTFHTTYNIRVVNLSIGTPAVDAYWNDPICQAVRSLVDQGVVVIAAAGNNGKDTSGTKIYGRIHSPGNEPSAITVGASNSLGTDARGDDTVTTYSSRGPTRSYWTDSNQVKHYDNIIKPDLVAPGNKIVGAAATANHLLTIHPELDAEVSSVNNYRMMYLSGTSMATPVTAGGAALLLQANSTLTPNLVKSILTETSQPLAGADMFEQGTGEINISGAVQLAKLVRTDLNAFTAVGEPLLTDAPPPPQTTIAGQTFTWAQGITLNHTYAYGSSLASLYQRTYETGYILNDGVVEDELSLSINLSRMSSGVTLGTSILISNGGPLGSGINLLGSNMLLGNGILIGDSILIGDGILIGDSILIGDGILIGDTVLQAQSAMTNGDNTAFMH